MEVDKAGASWIVVVIGSGRDKAETGWVCVYLPSCIYLVVTYRKRAKFVLSRLHIYECLTLL